MRAWAHINVFLFRTDCDHQISRRLNWPLQFVIFPTLALNSVLVRRKWLVVACISVLTLEPSSTFTEYVIRWSQTSIAGLFSESKLTSLPSQALSWKASWSTYILFPGIAICTVYLSDNLDHVQFLQRPIEVSQKNVSSKKCFLESSDSTSSTSRKPKRFILMVHFGVGDLYEQCRSRKSCDRTFF